VTETLTSSLLLACGDYVPAGFTYRTCATLASPATMAAAANTCVWCPTVMTPKIGDGFVPGTMLGERASASDEWTWSGPFCNACVKAHGRRLD